MIGFLAEMPAFENDLYNHKKMKTNPEIAKQALEAVRPVLEGVGEWTEQALHDAVMAFIPETAENGQMFCRCASPFPAWLPRRAGRLKSPIFWAGRKRCAGWTPRCRSCNEYRLSGLRPFHPPTLAALTGYFGAPLALPGAAGIKAVSGNEALCM